jgi:hypothetical protein
VQSYGLSGYCTLWKVRLKESESIEKEAGKANKKGKNAVSSLLTAGY